LIPLKPVIFVFEQKSPSAKRQRAGFVRLPLLERFGTFKENILIDNIKLNQLILQY